MEMNSLPRWLISITDMPLPCQSSISAAAFCNTGSGSTAGPALKLKTRMRISELVPSFSAIKGAPERRPLFRPEKWLSWLRDSPQVGFVGLEALRILFLRVIVGYRRRDDDVFARLPV